MTPVGVVKGSDGGKDDEARLLDGGEALAGEELTRQAGEEGRGDGVVVAIADGAHRRGDAGASTAQ